MRRRLRAARARDGGDRRPARLLHAGRRVRAGPSVRRRHARRARSGDRVGARFGRSARRRRRAPRCAGRVGTRRRSGGHRVERHDDRRRDRPRDLRAVREVRRRREGPQRRARRRRSSRRSPRSTPPSRPRRARARGAAARIRTRASCWARRTSSSRSAATTRCAPIRERCNVDARFVPFGHRAGIGLLAHDAAAALDARLADRIVRDALLYDGEGCLSLHALFVEADGETLARVAATLAAALERVAIEFPGGERAPQRTARVAQYRDAAAFRAAGGRGAMLRAADAVLVVDPPPADALPFLPRVLPLIPVAGDDDVAAYVRAHRLPVQSLGIGDAGDAAVALAARIGAVRVGAVRRDAGSAAGRASRRASAYRRLRALDRPRMTVVARTALARARRRARALRSARRHVSRRRLSRVLGERARRDRRGRRRQPLPGPHVRVRRRRDGAHERARRARDRGAGARADPRHGRRAPDRGAHAPARAARRAGAGRPVQDVPLDVGRRSRRVRAQDGAARHGQAARDRVPRRVPRALARRARGRRASTSSASRSRRSSPTARRSCAIPGARRRRSVRDPRACADALERDPDDRAPSCSNRSKAAAASSCRRTVFCARFARCATRAAS